MNLRTEKEVLIEDLNRAKKLCEEASLNYMNMCKRVEVLEKCLDEIEKVCKKYQFRIVLKEDILQLIKQAKEDE